MKFVVTAFILFVSSSQAWAEACAVEYNQAVGNSDVFSFDEKGQITVHKPEQVRVNERKPGTHRIVLKSNRAEILVRYQDNQIVSIKTGLNRMRSFDGKCQKLQEAMDDNTRTKVDAAYDTFKAEEAKKAAK